MAICVLYLYQMKRDRLLYKGGKPQNVVPTNEGQNMAAAVECDTLRDAEVLFRQLQHANDRGTTGAHYAELERRWEIRQGSEFGKWLEKVAVDQS